MPKKIIKTYVTFSFLLSLSHAFFFATYQLFLASRGMNLLEINVINMFFMAGMFLMEVPTGAFADIFGRKKSVVAGCFALSLSMLVYFIGNNFWMFVAAELIGALGLTFLSGALEAWVVDALAFHGYDGELSHVFRRETYATQIGIIFGSLAGGYLGERSLALPWLVSAIATFLVGCFAIFALKEMRSERKKFTLSLDPFRRTISDSIALGYKNKSVWFVILFGMLLAVSVQGMNMQWPFVFQNTFGFFTSKLGWLFVAISVFTMLGGQLSKYISSRIKQEKNAVVLSQGITAIGILGASSMAGVVPVTFAFLLHELGRGVLGPIKQNYLNNRIPSEQRATILSFDSMIGRSGSFLGLLGSGYLANQAGIPLTWFVSGCVLVIGVFIFFKLKNGE